MAVRITNAARSAAADAIVDLIDAGTPPGLLRVYSGSQPAGPSSAATGTLLAEFEFATTAFGAASNGVATAAAIAATTGLAAADAGYFRVLNAAETAIFDGSVTATGGGGDLQLNTITISVGVDVEITSFTVTMPVSDE